VDAVRLAREVTPDMDHAVAMVAEQDRGRHPRLYAEQGLLAKQEALSGTQANVAGIMRWLDLEEKSD
jgi:hypothetical protein